MRLIILLGILYLCIGGTAAVELRRDPITADVDTKLIQLLTEDGKGVFSPWISTKSSITPQDIQLMAEIKDKRKESLKPLTPVIIIPSLVGSVLTATLKNFKSNYVGCASTYADPFYLWLDNNYSFFFYINCWFEHMTLQFNPATNLSTSLNGVNVTTIDYGGVAGVDYLDPKRTIGLWNDTIAVLQSVGYEIGKNLRAAPYDWRRGPVEYLQYDFPRLKTLIEETYQMNNNTPVAFVSLSMGSPYFLSFLNNAVTQEWKDKYVHSWSSWDGAFGGSLGAVLGMTDWYFLSEYTSPLLLPFCGQFQKMLRSLPSFIWMLPISQYLWNDSVTVTSPQYGKFGLNDWPALLETAGANTTAQMLRVMQAMNLTQFQAPGVKTYCVFGTGIPTQQSVTFESDFNSARNITFADGDETILHAGLDICSLFQSQQEQPMIPLPVPGMHHGGSVHNKEVLEYFVRMLLSSS